MDPISQAAAAAGPWVALLGLLLAGLYAIMRGTLVPASHVERLTDQWEARLRELTEQTEQRIADSHQREQDWQAAYERTDQRADVADAQLVELMGLARTTVDLLRALPASGAPPTRPAGIPLPGRHDHRGGGRSDAD